MPLHLPPRDLATVVFAFVLGFTLVAVFVAAAVP